MAAARTAKGATIVTELIVEEIGAKPPLTASVTNSDGTDNVYVTTDPSLNQLTLTVTNGTTGTITLPAGQPMPYDQLPTGSGAVYLFVDGLLSNAEVDGIKVIAPGWSAMAFVDSGTTLEYLAIAPDNEQQMDAGKSLSFGLTNVLVAEQPTSGSVTVSLLGADGIDPDQATVSAFVNIANPPHPDNKYLVPDVVNIGFDVPVLYTGTPGDLILHLINISDGPLVPHGTNSWGPQPPTFQLTFLYGDEVGALTPLTDATQITGAIYNPYGNVWKAVQQKVQGKKPYWRMQPDPNGGGTVLGSGANATIEFRFSEIRATLPPGVDFANTNAYVSWSGIPGYNDGATGVPITKRAGPAVTEFSANPSVVGYGQSVLQTTLSWNAAHADGVTFRNVPGVDEASVFSPQGSGPIEGGVKAQKHSPLTVIAFKNVDAGAEGQLGTQLTSSMTIELPQVTRTDIPLGGKGNPELVILRGRDQAFVFFDADSRFATIDLRSPKQPVLTDLNTLVKSPLTVARVQDAASSPDSSLLYIAAFDPNNTPWVLTLDLATNTISNQWSIARPIQSNQKLTDVMLIAAPDGKKVFASTQVTSYRPHVTEEDPFELLTLDASSGAIIAHFPWGLLLNAGHVFATTPDGSKLFQSNPGAVAIMDASDGSVVSMVDFADSLEWSPLYAGVLAPGGRQIYVPVLDFSNFSQKDDVAPIYIATIEVDPDATELTLGRSLPLGTFGLAAELDTANTFLGFWRGTWTALSADATTLYVLIPPWFAVIDLATEEVQWWPAASSLEDLLAPRIATGSEPNVIYTAVEDFSIVSVS
jgi:hypothetical protein